MELGVKPFHEEMDLQLHYKFYSNTSSYIWLYFSINVLFVQLSTGLEGT